MEKIRVNILAMYDFILALCAITVGIVMLNSSYGVVTEYPKQWLSKIPFTSFVIPGIIVIVLFGLGNIIAAMFSLKNKNSRQWIATAIMGGILFITLIVQVIILGEIYLATMEFMFLSIIQLCLSGYVFNIFRKKPIRSKI